MRIAVTRCAPRCSLRLPIGDDAYACVEAVEEANRREVDTARAFVLGSPAPAVQEGRAGRPWQAGAGLRRVLPGPPARAVQRVAARQALT